ncbi:MAG TPA: rRNA maturation RNase YbeY [Methylocella sp.]|nr:rRNA maturation RNase YbeY [Methylocella sp.]
MPNSAKIVVDVAIGYDGWDALEAPAKLAKDAIDAAIATSRIILKSGAEVSVLLCDDATIRELNRKWRHRDEATNVLAFPAPASAPPLLGDIVIAFETTAREAAAAKKTLRDHTSHLLVHGFLHLIGFDHEDEDAAELMEAKERATLAKLGIADPYQLPIEEAAAANERS